MKLSWTYKVHQARIQVVCNSLVCQHLNTKTDKRFPATGSVASPQKNLNEWNPPTARQGQSGSSGLLTRDDSQLVTPMFLSCNPLCFLHQQRSKALRMTRDSPLVLEVNYEPERRRRSSPGAGTWSDHVHVRAQQSHRHAAPLQY